MVGDVLGSGIYVLVGLVAAAVGGAFWMAFLAGVAIATITGLAYAELVTKYPQAAGASLYINKAFRSPLLTFFITICMLSANMAAVGSLASGFVRYFSGVVGLSEDSIWVATLVALVFVAIITLINLIGITESVVVNVVMTFIELSGLVIVVIIGIIALVTGVNDPGVLLEFSGEGSQVIAVLAGVSLAFFAMTGFENAANVAEETIDPSRAFPRALIGGMLTAGVVYVLVSISAALAVPISDAGRPDAARGHPRRPVLHPSHDHAGRLRPDRHGRHQQHHAGHRGRAVPHPVRDGARGRRARRSSPRCTRPGAARTSRSSSAPPSSVPCW